MPRKKKTAAQRVKDRTKKYLKRTGKKVQRKAKRTKKAVTRRVKKARRKVTKVSKRAKRQVRRRVKKIRRTARKRLRSWKRSRAKAIRRQYTKRNLSSENPLIGGYTADRTATKENVAFLPDFGNEDGASKPGEPPKKRTGKGQSAIKAQLVSHKTRQHDVAARTYIDKRTAAYMALWEYRNDGEGRPFLSPSFKNNKQLLSAGLGKRLKRKLNKMGKRL